MSEKLEHAASTDPAENPGVRPGSLASRVGAPRVWDHRAAINYEVAMDTINDEAGAWIAYRAREREKENPDPQVLAECRQKIIDLEQRRRSLLPTDIAAMEAAIEGARERIEAVRNK